jgi:hypothetical protein
VLLVESDPQATSDWLEYALVASRWPEDGAAALVLFDHLTEPQAELQQAMFGGPPRFTIRLRGSAHWLREACQTLFTPNMAEAAPELLVIVDRHLRRAHQLLTATGSAGSGWDTLTMARSAIDPHPQDSHQEPIDVLIDIARDCLEVELDRRNDLGRAYLDSWAGGDVPLLRRLAVHGWTHRGDVDATTKLSYLRDRGWLYDHRLRHEVFRLIQTTLADADGAVADALVLDVLGDRQDADEIGDYETYNMLAWMVRCAPELRSARDALCEVQANHPDFQERRYPDLLAWSEVGALGRQPPMTSEALHELIEADVDAAVAELRHYEGASSPFDGPTWVDATGVLAETVREWPADGFAVLNGGGSDHVDLMRAVIRGWADANVDKDTAGSIIERLSGCDLTRVADDVAAMLATSALSPGTATEWQGIHGARRLAVDVWAAIGQGVPALEGDNWFNLALRHPAGALAQFWLDAVATDWRNAGDAWSGLPSATREQLDALLAGHDDTTAMAEVIFAGRLHFFFAADRDWCEQKILPLLDWADPARARRAWDAFLPWGRWNDALLGSGLLPYYLETAVHIGEFTKERCRQLCQHLAHVALESEIDPIANGWVRTFTARVDAGVRTGWMAEVGSLLGSLPIEAVEHQWQRWMRHYWQDRLKSVPARLTLDEASAMASWVVYLTDSVHDGVALAVAHPAQLGEHCDVLRDLTEERVSRAPMELTKLLVHLLKGTEPPFYPCSRLRDTVALLRAHTGPVDLTALVEQAVRLECGDAANW